MDSLKTDIPLFILDFFTYMTGLEPKNLQLILGAQVEAGINGAMAASNNNSP